MGPVPVEHGPGTCRASVRSHLPAAFYQVSDNGYLAGMETLRLAAAAPAAATPAGDGEGGGGGWVREVGETTS